MIKMSDEDFKKEHKRLLKILLTGSLAERRAEAEKQKEEMREYATNKKRGKDS